MSYDYFDAHLTPLGWNQVVARQIYLTSCFRVFLVGFKVTQNSSQSDFLSKKQLVNNNVLYPLISFPGQLLVVKRRFVALTG